MKKFKDHTVKAYLDVLASKDPAPGGGSAAALTAATGAALISMAAHYSLGLGSSANDSRIKTILAKSEKIRRRLVDLVDLDAEAYLKVVKTRKADAKTRRAALQGAIRVPREVGALCCDAIRLTPELVKRGNPHLLSDVEVAAELLLAAFNSAMINVAVNQK